ncbi:hypothetical protein [Moritella viscosa]|uniref:Uncharacterized protein n=1 Tax=Moritella viscosa TaxID=80854 RepID=A0A1L0BVY5_9GAMM|nr:hypothetical protein [Moritella viscosa]SGZ04078.1 Putative uncharacterized protein [Moritella viscosa]
MSLSDHKYVNFSEDYELNYHLKQVDKRQTEDNRTTLIVMGNELKSILDKNVLTHSEFREYISQEGNLTRLD